MKGLKELLVSGARDVEHRATINGTEFVFRPVRVAVMLRAQSVVTKLAAAVTSFFDPSQDQYIKRTLTTEQDKESGAIISASINEPVSPVHAKERLQRRQASVLDAIESVMGEDNAHKLALLVIDSLRAEDELTVEDVMEFDASTFIKLVKETVVANAPQLAPLLARATDQMARKFELSTDAGLGEAESAE